MKRNHTYIAGKITGLDHADAYKNFRIVEIQLLCNCKTINPMELCSPQWRWWRCMIVCLWNLITKCNRIYLLDNWNESRGAKIEVIVAILFRKEIIK